MKRMFDLTKEKDCEILRQLVEASDEDCEASSDSDDDWRSEEDVFPSSLTLPKECQIPHQLMQTAGPSSDIHADPTPSSSYRLEREDSEESELSEGEDEVLQTPLSKIWSLNGNPRERFPFQQNSGIKNENLLVAKNPVDFYEHFIDDKLIGMIVNETNRYADARIRQKVEEGKMAPRSRDRSWEPTNIAEVKLLLAILFLQGIVQKPRNNLFFSGSNLVQTPIFYGTMTEKRFFLLLKFLHFNDNDNFDPDCSTNPKLFKIRPVLDYLVHKFKTSYIPQQDISIDESLLLWKGRLGWKIYIPKKRARFGMESYRLCESTSGYVWNILTYTGLCTELAGHVDGINVSQLSKPSQIILTLSEELLNKGYLIAMDNYYSSPELFQVLCQLKTDAVGTVRVNRKNLPSDVIKSRLAKGEHRAAYHDKMMCLKWKDKKDVTMLSTIHGENFVSTLSRKKEERRKPVVVQDYNRIMGGVDLSDQYMVSYSIARRRLKKYYQKMFRHLIDVAMFNSFVIYQKQGGQLSHLNYRLSVIDSLVQKYKCSTQSAKIMRSTPVNSGVARPSRLTAGNHFPHHNLSTEVKSSARKRCVVCYKHKKRKETIYCCGLCDVPLCIVPCFERYHTQEEF